MSGSALQASAATVVISAVLAVAGSTPSECCGQDSQPATTTSPASEDNWGSVFERLRRARRHEGMLGGPHFDMHGNPSDDLEVLLKARFRPTRAICAELDRPNSGLEYADRRALFYVLGRVKDPSTIEWLRAHLSGPDADLIYGSWLSGWLHTPIGPTPLVKWLERPSEWSEFFTNLLSKERDGQRRLRLLHAMVSWLNDLKTLAFFERQARDPQVKGEELMFALLYLHIYGSPVDEQRLSGAIEDVRSTPGTERLNEYLNVFPHRAFLPLLLERAERDKDAAEGIRNLTDYYLVRITWQFGIKGAAAWKAWYAQHRNQSQEQWISGALEDLDRLVESDPERAGAVLHENPYIWTAKPAFGRLPKWLRHQQLREALISWVSIRLYAVRREWWSRLFKEIVAANRDISEEEWQELLGPVNDAVEREDTWEEQFRWHQV